MNLETPSNGERIYPRLCQLFEEADARYNSGLFHFKPEKGRHETPDELTLGLSLDDKLLRDIFRSLYYPESPYVFSALPADILGQVYEQFLGKVIRLTEGHHAIVEEKPEVKKAGGVYYTPTYIVNYIVENTVGKLLEGKTPKQASKLKILDPACGSGSFLLGAYEYLLKWHLNFYTANDPVKWAKGAKPALVQIAHKDDDEPRISVQGEFGKPMPKIENWRLTISERKRILLDNIFGVDIDSQAVETTKLSLLLKVLEGETQQSLQPVFSIFHERALPDLGDNIKCGNSLIGSDFYQQQQLNLLTEDERYRINVFDWDGKDGFSEIMGNGGFDAVIGNPPYIRIQAMKEWAPLEVEFYKERYDSAGIGNYDIYVVFVERSLRLLNKFGISGFILPNKFFNAQYGEPLRRKLAGGDHVKAIVHFGDQQVFSNATTYTCLLFLTKGRSRTCTVVKVSNLEAWRASQNGETETVRAETFGSKEWNIQVGAKGLLRSRLPALGKPLGELAHIFVGLQTSADSLYVLSENEGLEPGILKPFLTTGGLKRYNPALRTAWLIFPYELTPEGAKVIPSQRLKNEFPKAWKYLTRHQETLMSRDNGKMKHDRWYAYVYPKNLATMAAPKLVIQVTAKEPTVLLDNSGLYMTGGGAGPFYGIRPLPHSGLNLLYLLAILNSNFFGWVVRSQSTPLRGGYVKYSKQYIESAPIPDKPSELSYHRIITLVTGMIDLHKRLSAAKTPQEKISFERQIATTDAQIDKLVYELYELTPDEIAIVEGRSVAEVASLPKTLATPEEKPEGRKKGAYAEPPPAPTHPTLTPEQAEADAAHFYSAKEESPPYGKND